MILSSRRRKWAQQLEFYSACEAGDLATVRFLSTQVDINWRNPDCLHRTGLHVACYYGKQEVVGFLLTLPGVDVNKGDRNRESPLFLACHPGSVCKQEGVAQRLVRDPRVDVNKEDKDGATPLWWACRLGLEGAAKMLLASGRADTKRRGSETINPPNSTAAEAALQGERPQLATLIEEYERNPKVVTQRLRQELNWATPASAVFAQMIFLCDGLLELSAREEPAQRFFSIASRLPLDLQHLLANRSQGLAADHVPAADRELAFTSLAGDFHEN